MKRAKHHTVTIVGGGVAGLTTAVVLGSRGIATRVISADDPETTTSGQAGAFWYPFHAEPQARVLPLARRTYEVLTALCWQRVPGLRLVNALELHREMREPSTWARLAKALRPAASSMLRPEHRCGYLFRSIAIECQSYLAWLQSRARAQGTIFERRKLIDPQELAHLGHSIVIAAGIGSGKLAADNAVYGVRGRLLVTDSSHDDLLLIDEGHPHGPRYVIPHERSTVLGTNFERLPQQDARLRSGFDTSANEILDEIEADCRGLAGNDRPIGTRVGSRVAVRPCRSELRLQSEQIDGQQRVYNYGHGGAGFTLSWGCAAEVSALLDVPRIT